MRRSKSFVEDVEKSERGSDFCLIQVYVQMDENENVRARLSVSGSASITPLSELVLWDTTHPIGDAD